MKDYLSPADRIARHFLGAFPSDDEPGLRVFTAAPAYLFALKCRAMRMAVPDGPGDIDDIRRLGEELGITNAAEARRIPRPTALPLDPLRNAYLAPAAEHLA